MRVAIVHDWLVSYRGGEKVLEMICDLYPDAPIYTLFCDRKKLPPSLQKKDIRTPPTLDHLTMIRKLLLPLLPSFIESFSLWDYDLVISSSSCVAKGVLTGPQTKHISYIHSPMRYIWDQRDSYFQNFNRIPLLSSVLHLLLSKLRLWDTVSSTRVDLMIANSSFVEKRIRRYYGRSSSLIHPPIDTEYFTIDPSKPPPELEEPYYLVAGAFVPYKNFELAIEACEKLGRKLIIAGSGPCESSLRACVKKYSSLVISPKDPDWRKLLQHAKGLLFPGVEDFGMLAVEAMACGTPVLALKAGGALDYVEEGLSGLFFEQNSLQSLMDGIEKFEKIPFQRESVRAVSQKFDKVTFLKKITSEINRVLRNEIS
ncbi:MAG: glycosyltransferase [Oligoflexales bacterium]|nr:glycosyltransferase [Oligoflexales bacterium]